MTNQGWICPRCEKVLAPWMPHCSCHPKDKQNSVELYQMEGRAANKKAASEFYGRVKSFYEEKEHLDKCAEAVDKMEPLPKLCGCWHDKSGNYVMHHKLCQIHGSSPQNYICTCFKGNITSGYVNVNCPVHNE